MSRKGMMMNGQSGCSEITCTNISQIEKTLSDRKCSSKDDSTHLVEHVLDISGQVWEALTTKEALFFWSKTA